ncbi:MAG: hypothetical protein J7507_12025 [Pseudoxanthomonas sp.]|nr:hypothetical protein [Pseudoxanthomonas sp.]
MVVMTKDLQALADRLLQDQPAKPTCPHGKICYATPQDAHKALRGLGTHHRKPRAWNHGKPDVYQCRVCKQWHTTCTGRRDAA